MILMSTVFKTLYSTIGCDDVNEQSSYFTFADFGSAHYAMYKRAAIRSRASARWHIEAMSIFAQLRFVDGWQ